MSTISVPEAEAAARPAGSVRRQHFEYLPVSLFGAVMGLTGLSVAWRLAGQRYGVCWTPA